MKRLNYSKTAMLCITALLVILVFGSCINSGNKKTNDQITPSGMIKEGIRNVDVDSDRKGFPVNAFRGETVRLIFEKQDYAFSIHMPDFDITKDAIPDEELVIEFKAETIGEFPVLCDCPSGKGIQSGNINVMEYTSGSDTFFKDLSAREAKSVIETEHPFILDVRTQGEYDSGYIPGAKLIPVQQLEERIAEIEQYKEKDILVYCRSGNRSIVATEILETNGFKKIYHLSSGIKDWVNEGFELMK